MYWVGPRWFQPFQFLYHLYSLPQLASSSVTIRRTRRRLWTQLMPCGTNNALFVPIFEESLMKVLRIFVTLILTFGLFVTATPARAEINANFVKEFLNRYRPS